MPKNSLNGEVNNKNFTIEKKKKRSHKTHSLISLRRMQTNCQTSVSVNSHSTLNSTAVLESRHTRILLFFNGEQPQRSQTKYVY